MKTLTAPQALRYVAAKIINEGKVDEGLCWELDKMYYHSTIRPDGSPKFPHTEFARANAAIRDYGGLHPFDCWLARSGTEHEARAMFALLLAEILDDESTQAREVEAA